MDHKSRHEAIVEHVQGSGFIPTDDLARVLGVTPQTIRRDINVLAEAGRVARFHGGVGPSTSVENMAYASRKIHNAEAKARIAEICARQIPDRASLFINIGTTNEAVARALGDHQGLRVITNNLNVAVAMSASEANEVLVAGGLVRNRDGGVVGEAASEFIRQFKADFGIIGISGIDEDGALLDFDYREIKVAQSIIANSRQVFLVADHSKFGRNAMVRLGDISMISALFTDAQPPAPLRKRLKEADVALHVASAP